jgi:DNA-directed RNA polymerase subunit E'/Rpb7
MAIKEIERVVTVNPSLLNSDLSANLLQLARELTAGKCSKEDGYILKINKILRVVDNYISSSNSSVFFVLKLEADVLKPEMGDVMSGKATMVLQQGIFIDVQGKFKVLIPANQLTDWEFDKTKSVYKKGDTVYKIGDSIQFKVVASRYEKSSFRCIVSPI